MVEPGAEFGARLAARGLDPARLIACRIALHPEDATTDIRSADDLAEAGLALSYLRMQDGARFGASAAVLGFIAQEGGRARLVCAARLMARPPGIAPGDLVYDPALAELLHNFITRATSPVFHDAVELEEVADLIGRVVEWSPDEPDHRPLAELASASARR